MGLLTSAAVLMLISFAGVESQNVCPGLQRSYCGCPRTCESGNLAQVGCTGPCVIGCYCPQPLFLSRTGFCVDANACFAENALANRPEPTPPILSRVVPSEQPAINIDCYGNRIVSTCATCEIFCSQRANPPACPLVCRTGCFCPDNTFVDEVNGNCVPASQCAGGPIPTALPPTTTSERTPPPVDIRDPFYTAGGLAPSSGPSACSNNQVYSECARCQRTCANRFLNTPCLEDCIPGCTCPDGQLLHQDQCVFFDGCPLEGVSDTLCDPPCGLGQTCQLNPLGYECV